MMPKCVASGYHGDNVVSVEVYACRACRTLWCRQCDAGPGQCPGCGASDMDLMTVGDDAYL